jgi:hypothetical protein
MLVEAKKTEYILAGGGYCFHCGSTNITPFDQIPTKDGEFLTHKITCKDCNESWEDVYILTDIDD